MSSDEEPVEEFELKDPLLTLKGMTPELAVAFRNAGYYTIESIAVEVPHILFQRVGEKRGFTLQKAEDLIKEARKSLNIRVMTIAELAELEKKAKTVTTGSKKLDEILGGGIHTQEVTEVCGPYATGKSELVYTTAVFSLDALKGSAIILDTEATLKAGRILEIAEARDLDPKVVAERISMLQCLSSAALITALESLHKQVKENNVRFLAVDSLVSPFRREYPGRELLAARQQKLNYCIGLLLKYAWTYNLAALVTNQVMAKPEAQFVPASMPEKERPPIGGFVLSHGVNTRIYLKDTAVPNRSVATIIDSSYLPRESCVIRITKRGIDDVEEKTAKKEDETVKKDAEASVNRV